MTRLVLVLALLLHLVAGFPYLASALVAPGWAVLSFWAVWAVLLVVLVLVWRRQPALSLLVPLLAVGFFFAAVTAGEQLLGWTA